PNRLDSSATVPSSRTAANATFALNSGSCFFRVLAMSHPRPSGRSKGRLSLSYLSSFRGPPQFPPFAQFREPEFSWLDQAIKLIAPPLRLFNPSGNVLLVVRWIVDWAFSRI